MVFAPSEASIEAYGGRQVTKRGGVPYKFKSPGRNGVPDRMNALPGEIIFIEYKAPGKKPTRNQVKELNRLIKLGLIAYYADTKAAVNLIMWMYDIRREAIPHNGD
jgi:hypothetical protein